LHSQPHDVRQRAAGQPAEPDTTSAEPAAAPPAAPPPPAAAAQPAPPPYRASPYPHGDIDWRFVVANVPKEPVRPQRGRASRRFYFLPDAQAEVKAPAAVDPPQSPDPKSG
jgi:hypothetical protein